MSTQELATSSTDEVSEQHDDSATEITVANSSSPPSDSSLPLPQPTADLASYETTNNNNPLISYFSNGEEGGEVSEEQTDNDDKINCAIINDRHRINEDEPTSCSDTKVSTSLQQDGQEDNRADNDNDGIDETKMSQEGHVTVNNDNAAPVSTGHEIDAPISSDKDDITTTQSDNDNAAININNNNDDDGDDNVAAVELKAISSSTIDANNKNCEFEIVLDSWEWSFGGSTAKI